jgi:hypothetical protein
VCQALVILGPFAAASDLFLQPWSRSYTGTRRRTQSTNGMTAAAEWKREKLPGVGPANVKRVLVSSLLSSMVALPAMGP